MQKQLIVIAVLGALGATAHAAEPASVQELQVALARAQQAAAEAQKAAQQAQEALAQIQKATTEAKKAAEGVKTATAGKGSGLSVGGVTIYGIADAGIEYGDYGKDKKVRVQSGLGSASRLGFKGERKLGDDLSAYFQLETGVSVDNGQNTGHSSNVSNPGQGTASSSAPNTTGIAIFSRNTFVGLKSQIGDIRFGRDYAPIYSLASATDPFTIGGATAFRLWSSAATSRFDNGFFYKSPTYAGFQGSFAYSAGMENNSDVNIGISGANTSTGPEEEGKGLSANLTYKNGPLFLGAGYLDFKRTGNVVAPATENVRRKSKNIAGSYDFKVAKVYAHYLMGEDTQAGKAKTLDRSVWWLGTSVPIGTENTVRAVYGHLDDKLSTDRDSSHFGIGYERALDKQTDVYLYYAQVTNQNGGRNSLCAGGTCQGFDSDTGLPANYTPKALLTGVRYRF